MGSATKVSSKKGEFQDNFKRQVHKLNLFLQTWAKETKPTDADSNEDP